MDDPSVMRGLAAALVAAAYLAMCTAVMLVHRRRHRSADHAARGGADALIVAFASQTGFAEELARHAARSLHTAGVPARVLALSELTTESLRRAGRALFVVSTCGEGDPPDNAVAFSRRLQAAEHSLAGLHYGMLALGDRAYANFCGFGRMLDEHLRQRGAQPLFERVDVDNASEGALREWQQRLGHVAGTSDLPEWQAPDFAPWRLVERRRLNPGSAGGAIFHIELAPPAGWQLPEWQSGDLVQVLAPGDPQRAREYSIASIPADGRLHLLVRQEQRGDGGVGVASGWLTQHATRGDTIRLRVRVHPRFRLGDNAARPLILIGNGSGLAGLRSHLKARADRAQRNWLLFGERNAAHDFHYREQIEAWREQGVLERVDMVFSRDQRQRLHVQHALRNAAQAVREWVDDGAAIYVCGSLEGMAAGVDAALVDIIGAEALERLNDEGRYRRDVY